MMRAFRTRKIFDIGVFGFTPRSPRFHFRNISMTSHQVVNEGQQIDIAFSDNTSYRFHAPALKDCSVESVGPDLYRHAKKIWDVRRHTISHARVENDKLLIQ